MNTIMYGFSRKKKPPGVLFFYLKVDPGILTGMLPKILGSWN
jgi:hypothetical protein